MNLKELARELGLSQTTVSRALNGYPEVAEATRRRVAEAAERLNYRPNTRARSLATGRSMAIGHVIPLSTQNEIMNPIFADFIAGAGETYFRSGYDMVLTVVNDSDEARVYRELATKGAVDGLIVHAPRTGDPRIALLNEIGLPFVVHGRASAGRRRLQLGRRQQPPRLPARDRVPAGPRPPPHRARQRGRGDGLRRPPARGLPARAAQPGRRGRRALMASDEMTENYGYRAARRMTAEPDAPTAFIAASIIIALGVRRAIEEMGLRMGRDVSIVTFDDELAYLRNGTDIPIFTSLRASVREMGRLAAQMVLDQIGDRTLTPRQVLIEADLMVGQSTGPAPVRGRAYEKG
jgi:LacI family transcriptional regulator